jgi:hypothetical protein
MTVEVHHTVDTVALMISEFERTHDVARIETLADYFADSYDPRAIPTLLARLGDREVEEIRDVEDAVCGALIVFGVMRVDAAGQFLMRRRDDLKPDVRRYLRNLGTRIPSRYIDGCLDRLHGVT